jgi:hypothetical protein
MFVAASTKRKGAEIGRACVSCGQIYEIQLLETGYPGSEYWLALLARGRDWKGGAMRSTSRLHSAEGARTRVQRIDLRQTSAAFLPWIIFHLPVDAVRGEIASDRCLNPFVTRSKVCFVSSKWRRRL